MTQHTHRSLASLHMVDTPSPQEAIYKLFLSCLNFKNMAMGMDTDKKKPQRIHVFQAAVISQT